MFGDVSLTKRLEAELKLEHKMLEMFGLNHL